MKAGYKQTEVGVIPSDWMCVAVADAAARKPNAVVGGPFGSDLVSADYSAKGVPVIRGQNMSARFVAGDFAFVTEQKAKSLSANLAYADDLVFTQRGTLGQVAVVPDAEYTCYLISQSQMKLSLDLKRHDPHFVYQYFACPEGQKQISDSAIQTGVPHTNLGILRSYQFPAPPLPEQSAIATALGDVDALLAAQDALIAKKRAIKQGAMQELLTGKRRLPGFSGEWEVKRLDELGQTYGGLVGKSKNDFGHGEALYVPFVNVMANVVIDADAFDKVDVSSGEAQNHVLKGDLLFNGSSETPEEVAMCALVADEVAGLYLNSFCFGFRLKSASQENRLFLAYYMRGQVGRELIKSLAQGSTRYNLSKTAFLDGALKLPDGKEQSAIADVLSDMDTELTALQAQRAKTAQLKQGMMQALLTGRIRLV